jgi:hypothetical protein
MIKMCGFMHVKSKQFVMMCNVNGHVKFDNG